MPSVLRTSSPGGRPAGAHRTPSACAAPPRPYVPEPGRNPAARPLDLIEPSPLHAESTTRTLGLAPTYTNVPPHENTHTCPRPSWEAGASHGLGERRVRRPETVAAAREAAARRDATPVSCSSFVTSQAMIRLRLREGSDEEGAGERREDGVIEQEVRSPPTHLRACGGPGSATRTRQECPVLSRGTPDPRPSSQEALIGDDARGAEAPDICENETPAPRPVKRFVQSCQIRGTSNTSRARAGEAHLDSRRAPAVEQVEGDKDDKDLSLVDPVPAEISTEDGDATREVGRRPPPVGYSRQRHPAECEPTHHTAQSANSTPNSSQTSCHARTPLKQVTLFTPPPLSSSCHPQLMPHARAAGSPQVMHKMGAAGDETAPRRVVVPAVRVVSPKQISEEMSADGSTTTRSDAYGLFYPPDDATFKENIYPIIDQVTGRAAVAMNPEDPKAFADPVEAFFLRPTNFLQFPFLPQASGPIPALTTDCGLAKARARFGPGEEVVAWSEAAIACNWHWRRTSATRR